MVANVRQGPATANLFFYAGDTVAIAFVFRGDWATGRTARMQVRQGISANTPLFELTGGSGLTVNYYANLYMKVVEANDDRQVVEYHDSSVSGSTNLGPCTIVQVNPSVSNRTAAKGLTGLVYDLESYTGVDTGVVTLLAGTFTVAENVSR